MFLNVVNVTAKAACLIVFVCKYCPILENDKNETNVPLKTVLYGTFYMEYVHVIQAAAESTISWPFCKYRGK